MHVLKQVFFSLDTFAPATLKLRKITKISLGSLFRFKAP